jgi:hypothetical protein
MPNERLQAWVDKHRDAAALECCAQCGKVLVPRDQVGASRVLGHGRDFCSMACADAWEPTCDCGCSGGTNPQKVYF